MHIPIEITVLFIIISFLVYTMPSLLANFSRTLKGKLLLLVLTIVITLHNQTGGLIMAMFFIFLSEFNYEYNIKNTYEGFSGDLNYAMDSAVLIKKPKQDRLTIEEALMPIDSCLE